MYTGWTGRADLEFWVCLGRRVMDRCLGNLTTHRMGDTLRHGLAYIEDRSIPMIMIVTFSVGWFFPFCSVFVFDFSFCIIITNIVRALHCFSLDHDLVLAYYRDACGGNDCAS